MGQAHVRRRVAAVAAVVIAIVVVAVVLLSRAAPYTITATFENASQLVKGNVVQVAGINAGTVKDIQLTDDGRADVELEITGDYKPLRQGTRAVVRQASLSGVANRYVDLQLGEGGAREMKSGGRIPGASTESAVDLDQFFNTFDPVARTAVQRSFAGFGEMYAGRTKEANEAFRLLNPSLASASRLFRELNRDSGSFDRFIVESAKLVRDTADRSDDLAGVIDNLATTSSALASQRQGLSQSIDRLPDFMRKSNTTFVNLRAALDDLDPLVAESRPTLRRLRPFLRQLRPLTREAVPTVRDFSRTIRQPGADNDLVELLALQRPIDRFANEKVQANGEERDGAFAAGAKALDGGREPFAFARPYAPDLIGWFDDFSHTGMADALGNFSRAGLGLNAFSFTPAVGGDTVPNILPVPPEIRDQLTSTLGGAVQGVSAGQGTQSGRNNRCPGSSERQVDDSNGKPSPDFNCDDSIRPIGP